MPAKKRTNRRSQPKEFRCTGYGDCRMVFTRSEHLARHIRKHTGEKPYECIVPGCGRRFSRYDNMMQHTHTHDRRNNHHRTTITTTTTTTTNTTASTRTQEVRSPSPCPHSLREPPRRRRSMVDTRTLPPPLPDWPSYSSSPWASNDQLPPSPCPEHQPSFYSHSQPLTLQHSPWTPASPASPPKRRLSSADLQAPIHFLGRETSPTRPQQGEEVDVTLDEYEALQGLGRFQKERTAFDSPCLATQVTSFRQRLLPIQESFQRPLRSPAI